jgi:hypothetical protein
MSGPIVQAGINSILERLGWTVPEGWKPDNVGRCRSCDAEILWCWTPANRKAPVNRDGISHFATCPAAGQWRKKPA